MGRAASQKVSNARKTVVEVGPTPWLHAQASARPEERHIVLRLPDGPGLSPESIVRTLPRAQAGRLKFLEARAGRWPVKPASADEVHLPNPSSHANREGLFSSAAKLLRPGGKLFVVEANPFAFPASRASELAIAAGLKPVELRTGRRSADGYQPFVHSFAPLPSRFADQRYLLFARRPKLLSSQRKR